MEYVLMDIEKELYYRASIAVDFLPKMINSDFRFMPVFTNGKPSKRTCDVTNHLMATSALYSGAKLLDKKKMKILCIKILEDILKSSFSKNNETYIIEQQSSYTNANAAMAILCHKMDRPKLGIKFARTIPQCIHHNALSTTYRPATNNDTIKKLDKINGNYGLAIIALMLYRDQDKELLKQAQKISTIMMNNHPQFNPCNAWAANLMSQIFSDKKYKLYVRYIMKFSNKFTTDSMTSLVAATSQQINLCWFDISGNENNFITCNKILKRQFDLQVSQQKSLDVVGAFIRSQSNKSMRVDYIARNLLSFIQYLTALENKSIPANIMI